MGLQVPRVLGSACLDVKHFTTYNIFHVKCFADNKLFYFYFLVLGRRLEKKFLNKTFPSFG